MGGNRAGAVFAGHRNQHRAVLRFDHYQRTLQGTKHGHGVGGECAGGQREFNFHAGGDGVSGSLGKAGDFDDRQRGDGSFAGRFGGGVARPERVAGDDVGMCDGLRGFFCVWHGAGSVAVHVGDFSDQSSRPGGSAGDVDAVGRDAAGDVYIFVAGEGAGNRRNLCDLRDYVFPLFSVRVEDRTGDARADAGEDPGGLGPVAGAVRKNAYAVQADWSEHEVRKKERLAKSRPFFSKRGGSVQKMNLPVICAIL